MIELDLIWPSLADPFDLEFDVELLGFWNFLRACYWIRSFLSDRFWNRLSFFSIHLWLIFLIWNFTFVCVCMYNWIRSFLSDCLMDFEIDFLFFHDRIRSYSLADLFNLEFYFCMCVCVWLNSIVPLWSILKSTFFFFDPPLADLFNLEFYFCMYVCMYVWLNSIVPLRSNGFWNRFSFFHDRIRSYSLADLFNLEFYFCIYVYDWIRSFLSDRLIDFWNRFFLFFFNLSFFLRIYTPREILIKVVENF